MSKRNRPDGDELAPVAILGGGNVGRALARGWVEQGRFEASEIHITRRHPEKLSALAEAGFAVGADNRAAIEGARHVIIAVQPQQLRELLAEINDSLDPALHTLISVVSGASIRQIAELVGDEVTIVRAM